MKLRRRHRGRHMPPPRSPSGRSDHHGPMAAPGKDAARCPRSERARPVTLSTPAETCSPSAGELHDLHPGESCERNLKMEFHQRRRYSRNDARALSRGLRAAEQGTGVPDPAPSQSSQTRSQPSGLTQHHCHPRQGMQRSLAAEGVCTWHERPGCQRTVAWSRQPSFGQQESAHRWVSRQWVPRSAQRHRRPDPVRAGLDRWVCGPRQC